MLECSSIDLFHFKVTGMEENVHRLKVQEETSKRSEFQHLLDPLLIFVTHALNPYCDLLVCREADDLLRQLQEEQRKTISLTQEMSTSSSSRWVEVEVFVLDRWGWYPFRQSLHQAKEKIRDLEKDNVILRYALTVEWAQVILFMKGKQRETSELCLWHGERTEIHGMESWRNNKNFKIVIFSRQQRMRWRFRFLSLRQHWSRIWTTKAVWLRLLQGRGRLLLRWSRISRFLSTKLTF